TGVAYLDLARAAEGDEPELSAAVLAAVRRGRYVLGSEVAAFESEWAAFCGAARAVGVANGTDAITLALRALGVGPGDEVLTVSMTCAPTATGILRAGATPVFVDVEEDRLTMDAGALAAAVTPRTKAILPVHLYGRVADVEAIGAFARQNDVLLVEDCAQAHGAAWNGRPAGTFGRAAAWSFYPTKNLGALGDGGAVTVVGEGDAAVADRVARLRVYGYVTRNDAAEPGYNSRLDEVQAAALRVRLRKLSAGNRRRAAIAARYDAALAGAVRVPPPAREGESPAHHLYVVRVPDRDAFRARLAGCGIGTDVHYPRAVHEQPAFASLPRGPLPVTERAMREVVSLPLDPHLTDAEADRVIEAVLASAR
ncbi:MAG TPA: DegT/DnrJ/EryC1/StrS family aminotransferase, partial [Thermoanaerobaculia bacterium]|nr:DegT/DnrJ/EryC1/StrS family aminotransferase [Thermoanaerobaculia bacterium]